MSNLTDFFPSGGGGGLTPKFQEFNTSGTFTPSQALIDAGGYIEVFLVGGGGGASFANAGGAGGEVIIKKMYLTSTGSCSVTIGSGSTSSGGNSEFLGSGAGGEDVVSLGGDQNGSQSNKMGAGFGAGRSMDAGGAGSGVFGYGAGGRSSSVGTGVGVNIGKPNSGQGAASNQSGGSGYCLIKWYE